MLCAIWYHSYNLKIMKNTQLFFTFFKLYKWYQIAKLITNSLSVMQFLSLKVNENEF